MIRVLIDVSPAESGWTATISAPVLSMPIVRPISRLGNFPVPMAGDLPRGLDERARKLAMAADPVEIDNVRVNLAVRQPGEVDVALFGDYLHAALFGRHWESIAQAASGQTVELALRWPVTEWELSRLPWEIMRAPDAQSGKWAAIGWTVAITRIVPRQSPERKLRVQPKVLFVIGTDMNDISIRPGAEFFTVWDRLVREGISFDFRILQQASSEQIEDELNRFQPSIVHFICHGSEADGSGFIELVSADSAGQLITDQRDAKRCLALLRGAGDTYPPIVVLSACYSGGGAGPVSARVDAPLAAALVEGGVPIVVGMGGQISDLACRLFARRFYEALLDCQPVTDATFEGRRAGMKHGMDPELSVDWALPMLFMAEGLDPVLDMDRMEVERVEQRADRADRLRGSRNPMAFCDRIDVMEAQRSLTSPGQRARVLVLEETDIERDQQNPDDLGQFGKTRVLREIAARLVLDGHLPCLLMSERGDESPTSASALVSALSLAVADTASFVAYSARIDSQLERLNALLSPSAGAVGDLEQAVRAEYEIWRARVEREADRSTRAPQPSARLIAAALRADLRALAVLARAEWQSPDLRVVVLVDDVHLFDDATRTFTDLIGPDGLGDRAEPVPVAFAFSSQPRRGSSASVSQLTEFIGRNNKSPYFSHLRLERFKSTDPDPFASIESLRTDPLALVYHQYLLNLSPGVFVRPGAEAKAVQWFLNAIHQEVLGVPSRLQTTKARPRAEALIDSVMSLQAADLMPLTIERVDDEQALKEFRSLVPWK